ncbi:hypothetical protein BC941DRAFT_429979 [Chlamydoabsidia padenii]|nr:hypothetical protein BC941DRAFT_429979 [Chlamydoabsidia padenii]
MSKGFPLLCIRSGAAFSPMPHQQHKLGHSLRRIVFNHTSSHQPDKPTSCCNGNKNQATLIKPSVFTTSFWNDTQSWQRARINTFRCLIGCTTGDFATMWYLQYHYPTLSPILVSSAAMAAGLSTSLLLETFLLKRTIPGVGYTSAFKMALEMSFASMMAMEMAENAVDWHLMGGQVVFDDPKFWLAAFTSAGAGYLVPLPYNYWRLKALGKACH